MVNAAKLSQPLTKVTAKAILQTFFLKLLLPLVAHVSSIEILSVPILGGASPKNFLLVALAVAEILVVILVRTMELGQLQWQKGAGREMTALVLMLLLVTRTRREMRKAEEVGRPVSRRRRGMK